MALAISLAVIVLAAIFVAVTASAAILIVLTASSANLEVVMPSLEPVESAIVTVVTVPSCKSFVLIGLSPIVKVSVAGADSVPMLLSADTLAT